MQINKTDKRFFFTVYFVQGAVAISSLALLHFQKDVLNLSAAELATFGALITLLAWSFKPIYALISDSFPIFGKRRKPYLIITSLLTIFSYLFMTFFAHGYLTTLVPLVIANIGLGFTDVLCDGLAIEKSNNENVGKLQNLCWGAKFFAIFLVSAIGGFLNEFLGVATGETVSITGIKIMFFITALLPIITLMMVLRLEEEDFVGTNSFAEVLKNAFYVVFNWFRKPFIKKSFYGVVGALIFIFLWRATPSAGTAMQYFVINERGFNDAYLGITGSVAYLGHLLGFFVYGKYIDKMPIRKVFFWTIFGGTLFGLLNLLVIYDWEPVKLLWFTVHYKTVNLFIDFFGGLIFYVSFLPILKLAAMICPKRREATMFAVIASVMNIGLAMSSQFGGMIWSGVFSENYAMLDVFYLTTLATNLILIPLIFLLPKKNEVAV